MTLGECSGLHRADVGYFQLNIENIAYLQFQKDENRSRQYRKKLLLEEFAEEFADKDFCDCRSQ